MTPITAPSAQRKRSSLRRFARFPSLYIGCLLLLGAVILALVGPDISGFAYDDVDTSRRLLPPGGIDRDGARHWFGTDSLGRDLLARSLHGTRVSLLIGLASVSVSAVIGIPIGLAAGYYKGRLGNFLMRLADVQYSFPFIVLAIAILASLGPSMVTIIVTLALWNWAVIARVTRAETLRTATQEYVLASQAQGATVGRILFRHILPNITAPLLVVMTTGVAQMMVAEGALSFLGMGLPPSNPSLGTVIGDERTNFSIAWWLTTMPGLLLALTVLGINLFGDGLRDYLDPKVRRAG